MRYNLALDYLSRFIILPLSIIQEVIPKTLLDVFYFPVLPNHRGAKFLPKSMHEHIVPFARNHWPVTFLKARVLLLPLVFNLLNTMLTTQ